MVSCSCGVVTMTVSVSVFPNSLMRKMTIIGLDPIGTPIVVKGAVGQTALVFWLRL